MKMFQYFLLMQCLSLFEPLTKLSKCNFEFVILYECSTINFLDSTRMTYDQATNPRLLHMNNDVYRKNIIGNLHFVCVCLYLPAIKRKLMQLCIETFNVSECVFNIIHNICIIKLLSDYIIQVFVYIRGRETVVFHLQFHKYTL